MKKIFMFVCIIFLGLCFAGCGKVSVSYVSDSISIFENETYEINKDDIEITGKYKSYSIFSLDESIAKVTNNIVEPVSAGNTIIRIKVDKKNAFFDINLVVKSGKIAKYSTVQKSFVSIDLNTVTGAYNKVLVNDDCTEIPQITYDSTIIDYDYSTGLITGKKPGRTVVNIEFQKCKTSFIVEIEKNIYTKSLEVSSQQVFENSTGKLNFALLPENANTYNFYLSDKDKDRLDFVVFSDGSYRSTTATKVDINYWYYDAKNHRSEIQTIIVQVIPKMETFDYKICDENLNLANNYLLGNTYKFVIGLNNSNIGEILQLKGNINCKNELVYQDNIGFVCDFVFTEKGDNTISIIYKKTLGGVTNEIKIDFSVFVTAKNEIKIGAKNSIYELFPHDDGNYVLYLNNENTMLPSSLTIFLKVNGEFDQTLEFQVYLENSDGSKTEVGSEFVPTQTGRYVFEVVFEEISLGKIVVIVE